MGELDGYRVEPAEMDAGFTPAEMGPVKESNRLMVNYWNNLLMF
jgi:hypothetical protein